MTAPILNRRDIEFFMYEMFNVESLTSRERYQDHDRISFNGAIDTAQAIAEKYFLPIRQKVDANCNLIEAHGSPAQIEQWVQPMREGRFAGTMAMTEPGAGSGLADLTTTAIKNDDGNYRLTGNKIYISGGDHDLNENIVHLVLGRIKGAPKGVNCANRLSVFIALRQRTPSRSFIVV
jgi:alkylation response protein AidB-like acyl-CoA dehydrogenase